MPHPIKNYAYIYFDMNIDPTFTPEIYVIPSTDRTPDQLFAAEREAWLDSVSNLDIEMHMSCGNGFGPGFMFDVAVNGTPMRRYIMIIDDLPVVEDLGNVFNVDMNYFYTSPDKD